MTDFNESQSPRPKLPEERNAVFQLLKQLSADNQIYFEQCVRNMFTTRMAECCRELDSSTDLVKDLVSRLQEISGKFDYDEHTPGNGFRSLVCICDVVVLRLISILRVCAEGRGSLMFRLSHYCKEAESFGAILRFLILAYNQVISLIDTLGENSLFPPLEGEYAQYNGFLKCIESLDASCFYGRPLGFQFTSSVTRIFRIIGVVLATYSLSWESRTSAFGSLLHSGKLLLNPEERALRIIQVTREADIEFCRGFWNLSEIPVPKLFCPAMALCEAREIPMAGPMALETCVDGMFVQIPEPTAHTGPRPVRMKVLSSAHRVGLSGEHILNKLPLSPNLVIHCHGGGYVATSSRSHETYLRTWAKSLNCTLVSIDYSLAPENPFPRPTEEVVYAYAWMINNPNKLGWTGERVCMVGDSAGGNLIVSVNLRLIELNVKRMPDGIVPIYTPFLFQYLPSPSRVLSFMDPLLHMGVVIRCAAAYTGSYSDEELDKDCMFSDKNKNVCKPHKSLLEYVNQVQEAQRDNILDLSGISDDELLCAMQAMVKVPDEEVAEEEDEDCVFDVAAMPTNKKNLHTPILTPAKLTAIGDNEGFLTPQPRRLMTVGDASSAGRTPVLLSGMIKSRTTDCVQNFFFAGASSPGRAAGRSTPRNSASHSTDIRVISSAGRTPIFTSGKRKLSRSLSQSLAETAALAAGHAYDNISEWLDTPKTPIGHTDKLKLTRAATMSAKLAAQAHREEAQHHKSHFTELLNLKLPRNYLMSPLYAPAELLCKLPPVRFVACHMDPLLDDTVMFARKMRDSGGHVASVDILESLPHGFLNFAPMSVDCYEGARLCLDRVKEVLIEVATTPALVGL